MKASEKLTAQLEKQGSLLSTESLSKEERATLGVHCLLGDLERANVRETKVGFVCALRRNGKQYQGNGFHFPLADDQDAAIHTQTTGRGNAARCKRAGKHVGQVNNRKDRDEIRANGPFEKVAFERDEKGVLRPHFTFAKR